MKTCIACGEKKNDDEIILNFYKEPICVACDGEITKEAKQALNEICSIEENKCEFCGHPFNVTYEIICPVCGHKHIEDTE